MEYLMKANLPNDVLRDLFLLKKDAIKLNICYKVESKHPEYCSVKIEQEPNIISGWSFVKIVLDLNRKVIYDDKSKYVLFMKWSTTEGKLQVYQPDISGDISELLDDTDYENYNEEYGNWFLIDLFSNGKIYIDI